MFDPKKPLESQATLSRSARRAKGVVERLAPEHPAVAACSEALHASADTLIKSQDHVESAKAERQRHLARRAAIAKETRSRVLSWIAVARRDVASFASDVAVSSLVPTDVLANAERVTELAQTVAGVSAQPYGKTIVEQLESHIEALRAAEGEAQNARLQLQARQSEARQAANSFHIQVVGLRRILRVTVGTSHLDYQLLRSSRDASDDLEQEPQQQAPVEPEATRDDEPSGTFETTAPDAKGTKRAS